MSPYKPVKCVMFHMGGLLIDIETLHVDTFTEILEKYGAKLTDDVRLKVFGTSADETCRIFIEQYKLPVSLEDLRAEIQTVYDKNVLKTGLMPGAERLVTHLDKHNIPIAVKMRSDDHGFSIKSEANEEVQKLFAQYRLEVQGGSHVGFSIKSEANEEVQKLFAQYRLEVQRESHVDEKQEKRVPDVYFVGPGKFAEKPSYEDCLVFKDSFNEREVTIRMQIVMVPNPIVPEEERKLATKVISSLLEFKPEEFGLPSFTT